MKVYLINRETSEIKNTYENVISWAYNYVEYLNDGYRSKIYCDIETEYFSNEDPAEEIL